jgi:hypothetical protein
MDKLEPLELDYLPHILADVLHRHGDLLQESAREGRRPARLKLDRDACMAVARRQVEHLLEEVRVVEILCRARPLSSGPSYHGPSRDGPEGE